MRTILVSGASGVVGYGVLKSLGTISPKPRLIGTTIYEDSVAQAFCDIFEKAPLTSDANYLDWLVRIIKKHEVSMVIPGIDADMQAWNNYRQSIIAAGATPLLNNSDLIKLCSDKWLFYERLSKAGSQLVIESKIEGTFSELEKSLGLPFILKPRQGFASKGIVYVDSKEVFNLYKDKLGADLIAQPIIGNDNEEYTISAFFDSDSRLCSHMSLRRKLSKEGFTEKAEVAEPAGATEAITELARLLSPVGPTNFQFRVQEGKLKLLEINPRISSATSIRTAFGYNESQMAVEYFLEDKLPAQPKLRRGRAVRYVEDYIIYDSPDI